MLSYSVTLVSGSDESVKRACEEYCRKKFATYYGTIPSDEKRGELNADAVNSLREKYPKKNVMVVLTPHKAEFEDFTHVKLDIHDTPIKFHVYVFEKGNFTLLGDGGTINWCFDGNFKRNDKHVTFSSL